MGLPAGRSAVDGVLLAAGAGRRMGKPKATVIGTDGVPWIVRAVRDLLRGGCAHVVVVLGAGQETALGLLEGEGLLTGEGLPSAHVTTVFAERWHEGMGESLRAGLEAVGANSPGNAMPTAALIHLVDLPDVGADVIARVVGAAAAGRLARATYRGTPGHPVLIGAEHFGQLAGTLHGDTGAKSYLAAHDVLQVECGDLAGGDDVDFTFEN